MEFYLEWHSFLNELRLPTYQMEQVDFRDIFNVAELGNFYRGRIRRKKDVHETTNSRDHRLRFTWQDLYTIHPKNAAKLWELAHRFGYSYLDVNFDKLVCLDYMPTCDGIISSQPSDKYPPGIHPYPTDMRNVYASPTEVKGYMGWLSGGHIEHRASDEVYIH